MLVVIDHFTKWAEAFPTATNDAKTVAKIVLTEIIPRFSLPCSIDSDQGTHFSGKIFKTVLKALGIRQRLHCPWHPQSSGLVERCNRSIKNKITKAIFVSPGMSWVDNLPSVLMSMRAMCSQTSNLSPYEMLTGRLMRTPRDLCLTGGELHVMGDRSLLYCKTLSQSLPRSNCDDDLQAPAATGPDVNIGDQVYIKRMGKKGPFKPIWSGPYLVLLVGPISSKTTRHKIVDLQVRSS